MIDWAKLSHAEYNEAMEAGRADGERRMRELQEALGLVPKGPGRPRKNGLLEPAVTADS